MTRVLCGLNATLLISPSWPISVCMQTPVCVLYTRAVPSALALTNFEPVESNETSSTCGSRRRSTRSRRVTEQGPHASGGFRKGLNQC